MRPDEIDRILSSEAEIIPSSGFAESVMEAVRREAEDPQPIPFPWKQAIAGIAVWIVVVGLVVTEFVQHAYMDSHITLAQMPQVMTVMKSVWDSGLNWIALALAMSLVSLTAIKRLLSD